LCTRFLVSSNSCAHDVDGDLNVAADVLLVLSSKVATTFMCSSGLCFEWFCLNHFFELLSVTWLGNIFGRFVVRVFAKISRCVSLMNACFWLSVFL